jgi:hypothetical protein
MLTPWAIRWPKSKSKSGSRRHQGIARRRRIPTITASQSTAFARQILKKILILVLTAAHGTNLKLLTSMLSVLNDC